MNSNLSKFEKGEILVLSRLYYLVCLPAERCHPWVFFFSRFKVQGVRACAHRCVCVCMRALVCACAHTHVFDECTNGYSTSSLTSSPITNEGLLDKSAHVMLVPCSDMTGRILALDSMYYTLSNDNNHYNINTKCYLIS